MARNSCPTCPGVEKFASWLGIKVISSGIKAHSQATGKIRVNLFFKKSHHTWPYLELSLSENKLKNDPLTTKPEITKKRSTPVQVWFVIRNFAGSIRKNPAMWYQTTITIARPRNWSISAKRFTSDCTRVWAHQSGVAADGPGGCTSSLSCRVGSSPSFQY